MKRWLPAPLLSLALLVLWLLLNQSAARRPPPASAPWSALVLPLLTAPLRPPTGARARPASALRLIGVVAIDVVRSALQVARRRAAVASAPAARRASSSCRST